MQNASLEAPGLPATDYYAPDYKIFINGKELAPEMKGNVSQVKVVMDMENLTSFEFAMNYWDDSLFGFNKDIEALRVGDSVQVHMGYADELKPMARGMITTLSPRFPQSGPPTINVNGLDAMFCLRGRKPGKKDTKKFVKKTDAEIAEIVAQRNGLKAIVDKEGLQPHDLVIQKNQDEANFLLERAKRIDYDCYILTDPDSDEDKLHFVKPTDGREAGRMRVYVFEWGKTLIDFNPRITVSNQVSQVTVRGWDPKTKSPIEGIAKAEDIPGAGKGESGPEAVERCLGGAGTSKQDVVVDAPVTSSEEANKLAKSLLLERAYEFITGTGRVIGLPDLRPGDNVRLEKLGGRPDKRGGRFDGCYYVKKCTHTIGASGYITQFEVRKLFDGDDKC